MKLKNQRSFSTFFLSMLVCLLVSFVTVPAAWAKKADLPEVDSDGLHLLKHTRERTVYAKPGASLDQYTQVKILDCFVQFRKKWEHDYNMDELGLEGRVTDKDAEMIKKRLAGDFTKEFTKVLNKSGHEVVDAVGPNVLLVRPALINLDVTAPDVMGAGMQRTIVRSAGQMTLYMELYDSTTSTLLARVIDAEADDGGFAQAANRATNTAAADRILNQWAKELSEHLANTKEHTSKK
jgi:hypothetical protein